eukprot:165331_1
MSHMYTSLLIVFLITILFQDSNCKLNKKKPKHGKGPMMISEDDEFYDYNKKRLLMLFNISCIKTQMNDLNNDLNNTQRRLSKYDDDSYSDNDDHNNYHNKHQKYDDRSKDKMDDIEMNKLENNINSILDEFIDCLSEYRVEHNRSLSNHSRTYHRETKTSSFAFFNLECAQDLLLQNTANKTIDYDQLCIDYITYEPMIHLIQQTQDDDAECDTHSIGKTHIDKKYGLDLITSLNLEYEYSTLSQTNYTIDNVDIYIMDSGVDSTHSEFSDNTIYHEMDDGVASIITASATYYDDHGTHVAGIAAGKTYGISRGHTIYDYKVCQYYVDGDSANDDDVEPELVCFFNDIVEALDEIENKLANNDKRGVINLSIGSLSTDSMTEVYDHYFSNIIDYGGIIVAAAGNDYNDSCDYLPAK